MLDVYDATLGANIVKTAQRDMIFGDHVSMTDRRIWDSSTGRFSSHKSCTFPLQALLYILILHVLRSILCFDHVPMLHCVELILSLLNLIRGCVERGSGRSKGDLMLRCLQASGYIRWSCIEGVVKDLMLSYCSLLCHPRRWAVA